MRRNTLIIFGILFSLRALAQEQPQITSMNDSIVVRYRHHVILSGGVTSSGGAAIVRQASEAIDSCQYFSIVIKNRESEPISFRGTINGGEESIACESEPQSFPIRVVRHSVGKSHSLLNNAVYDRQNDWLISADHNANAEVSVAPVDSNSYALTVTGSEIMIRFRPHYYQQHRGLHYFHPEEYAVWQKPVVGWCSWFAYFREVSEKDIHRTADMLAQKLKPYGLEYLQIDDGYQQVPIGLPETWLRSNAKFPSGLTSLASYIRARGLVPGIWTNVSFADSLAALRHSSLFVRDTNGQPAYNSWVNYVMDGSNPRAIDSLVTPVYKGLNEDGFAYFKLDALRHLRYEGYNTFNHYFSSNHLDRIEAFRNVVREVRRQMGRDKFLLACWGIRPELVGIADGCRIGDDGYSYAGLTQFNSYNNIIWRNDPDHIVLSKSEAFRSCSATSLTGSLFMLTDKPELYKDSVRLEAARRSIPVLFTQPAQVYDVDPSHSSRIAQAAMELSGGGPRSFDAGASAVTGLFELEINKPYESWVVLGRVDDRDKIIPLKALGLDEKRDYLVFEFWTKSFRGTCSQTFLPGKIDTNFNCQVFCFRRKLGHPQLLATSRHISCGGADITDLGWNKNSLHGTSDVVAGERYTVYIHENKGDKFVAASASHAKLVSATRKGEVRAITFMPEGGQPVTWSARYK